jgi:alkylation response protein AidB-like acyl-CoA dehydrogenase
MTVAAAPAAFVSSAEQDEFRRVVAAFLAAKSPESSVREVMATQHGFDPALWRQLAGQLGLPGILVPEEFGGQGLSLIELAIAMEEMGRVLLCAPFLATGVLAVSAILASGDEGAMASYLPGIAAGHTIATLAYAEDTGLHGPEAAAVSAVPAGPGGRRAADGYRVSGRRRFVLDGASADLILLVAGTAAGPSLFAVTGDADGLTRTPLPTMDQTRKLADLDLDSVPARLVGPAGGALRALAVALAAGRVGLAAEQVGGAQAALASAVEYAGTRVQFGVPIGSFQAIKHRCADALVDVESARSVAYHAAWVAVYDAADLELTAAFAAAYCADAYTRVAATNIQVHGGLGFTWEHSAHLYLKRAKGSELLFGSPRQHRGRLADQLGL